MQTQRKREKIGRSSEGPKAESGWCGDIFIAEKRNGRRESDGIRGK